MFKGRIAHDRTNIKNIAHNVDRHHSGDIWWHLWWKANYLYLFVVSVAFR